MRNILYSIVLHLPIHLQSLDFRKEVPTLLVEQILVGFALGICDGVFIHGGVVGIANEFDALFEIRQKGGIVQEVGSDDVQLVRQGDVVGDDDSRFLYSMVGNERRGQTDG